MGILKSWQAKFIFIALAIGPSIAWYMVFFFMYVACAFHLIADDAAMLEARTGFCEWMISISFLTTIWHLIDKLITSRGFGLGHALSKLSFTSRKQVPNAVS